MKLFDTASSPLWLERDRKKHNIAAMALAFVFIPVFSILLVVLTCSSVGLRVVETSISKLAWENGYLIVAYVWGIVNLTVFMYLMVLALWSCGFNIRAKKAFTSLVGIATAIIMIGVSIPFLPGDSNWLPRFFHNFFATLGFVMFAAIEIALCVMLLFRDLRQGIAACAFMVFIIITGVYSIPQVNAPTSNAFVTAAAQLYVFEILEVLLALIYLTQPLFDRYAQTERAAKGEAPQASADNAAIAADDEGAAIFADNENATSADGENAAISIYSDSVTSAAVSEDKSMVADSDATTASDTPAPESAALDTVAEGSALASSSHSEQ